MTTLQIVFNGGRLGNQLFSFATAIAYCTKYQNIKPTIENKKEMVDILDKLNTPITVENDTNKMEYINDSVRYIELPKGLGGCKIRGWFQSEKYFSEYRPRILECFKYKHEAELRKRYEALLNTQCIAIHVRRCDYVNSGGNRFPTIPNSYYSFGISYFLKKFGENCSFLFFSDDIEYCKRTFGINHQFHYITNNTDMEDLMLMSYCNHAIIANSSFGWWGSWLNNNENKIVLSPADYLLFNFDNESFGDYIPKSYMQVSWKQSGECGFSNPPFDELTRVSRTINLSKEHAYALRNKADLLWNTFTTNRERIKKGLYYGRFVSDDTVIAYLSTLTNPIVVSEIECTLKLPPNCQLIRI